MLTNGCRGYLASMVDRAQKDELKPEDVLIVREYVSVFPDELLGFPPEWEISFEIELLPGSASVSKVHYHMAPTELKELQVQLQELLDKGFIR